MSSAEADIQGYRGLDIPICIAARISRPDRVSLYTDDSSAGTMLFMAEIIDVSKVEIDISTPCVIVGAGACRLVASLKLAAEDIETLVFERDATPHGSTSMSSGFIPAAGTLAQLALSVKDSTEQFHADIQHKANNEADPALVDAVINSVRDTLDWLQQQHGFQWQVLNDFLYPGHSIHRMHAVPGKTGQSLQQQLLSSAQSAGVNVVEDARVFALLTAPLTTEGSDKRVVGVAVERPDGTLEYVEAEAVILACNGYGANRQLIEKHIPQMAGAQYYGHDGNTGDAVLWGEALGARSCYLGAYQGHGSVAAQHNILITWALMMEGGIQVNARGVRFSNEHGGYSEQAEHVQKQPGHVAWNIYDERLHRLGLGFPDYQRAFEAGAVKTADSIEELAALNQLPEDALASTLQQIEKLAIAGVDEFGRHFTPEKCLQPPYYSVKVNAAIFHTQGGLAINTTAEVLNQNNQPIAGLYAAGGAAVGVSGSNVAGYLSGNGLLTAIGLGAIAAETVSSKFKSSEQAG